MPRPGRRAAPKAHQQGAPSPGALGTGGGTILWAEDGPDDQYLIRHALAQMPAAPRVRFVEDGKSALEALASAPPDLLVLDVNMPLLDGVETLRRIRSDRGLQGLPVVVFSTGREEGAVAQCRRLGVAEYIQKPFHYDDFARAVQRICALAPARAR